MFCNITDILRWIDCNWLVTIPFNFEQRVYHHKQSNRQSIVTAVLEKDYSFSSFRLDKLIEIGVTITA